MKREVFTVKNLDDIGHVHVWRMSSEHNPIHPLVDEQSISDEALPRHLVIVRLWTTFVQRASLGRFRNQPSLSHPTHREQRL
jgi:hypothetical protein